MNIYQIRQTLRKKSIYDIDLRVGYYARVSSDKEEQKNSIKNQKGHFEDLINSNQHWTLSGGYIDDGISGIRAEKREEFQRMIRDAKSGKLDLIITKEISRFARNTLDSIQYTRELLSYGVCVWFQNDNINTVDDDSEFRLTIMAGVAQDEIRKLSSRVKFGHAQSIKNGVVMGNSRIYGYNKDKGRLVIDEKEAIMIRDIFEKYATGEWSTPMLEKYLYEKGYRNHNGGKIDRNVLRHIIPNPKYKGWYAGGKVKIVDMFTKKQEFLPEEEWNLFKDDGSRVPAIVSEEIWELANKHFRERSEVVKSRRTSFKGGNLFTGKIYCANDGATYWMKQHYIRGKEDVRWVCSHKIKNGAASCNSFGLAESELKLMIIDIISTLSPQINEMAEKYISIYGSIISQKECDNKRVIEGLDVKLQNIKAKMEKLLDYNLNGAISDAEFIRRNSEYNAQIKDIEEQAATLKTDPNVDHVKEKLRHISSLVQTYAHIGTDDIDHGIISNLVKKIIVQPVSDRKADITFILNGGEQIPISYRKEKGNNPSTHTILYMPQESDPCTIDSMGCSDNIFTPKKSPENPLKSRLGCSENMMLNIYPEQHIEDLCGFQGDFPAIIMFPERHMTFYRRLRSREGHKLEVNYTYKLAI